MEGAWKARGGGFQLAGGCLNRSERGWIGALGGDNAPAGGVGGQYGPARRAGEVRKRREKSRKDRKKASAEPGRHNSTTPVRSREGHSYSDGRPQPLKDSAGPEEPEPERSAARALPETTGARSAAEPASAAMTLPEAGPPGLGRVGAGGCPPTPPSEPYVKVSLHTAQAVPTGALFAGTRRSHER